MGWGVRSPAGVIGCNSLCLVFFFVQAVELVFFFFLFFCLCFFLFFLVFLF